MINWNEKPKREKSALEKKMDEYEAVFGQSYVIQYNMNNLSEAEEIKAIDACIKSGKPQTLHAYDEDADY